ncbi:MAG: hypothetical protein K9L82_15660 [Chromatiaceae bacterium]|uniref:hypothetical protein n=1 Tax=Lamprobacter modestohalophilus TaxID=1064514 RepID=UPI001904D06A|nr:hypothetical protein [Lamprobacter modestohalophilus]MCF7979414.1 hypothetical protein [Chromatiaceae bacterium]MCF8017733.1 hypothetical protein [Chromatiaceae bacterium]
MALLDGHCFQDKTGHWRTNDIESRSPGLACKQLDAHRHIAEVLERTGTCGTQRN